ncbi:DUF2785 domain-containing protein [Paracerasibacillus soli]|uniref:DUF2785 domain-containing protein n=1 Tax=Paracerasibacillus soli TaxID=480284 RepID=A0ABU5CU42_9BACI|nr:DUF2785 domain-containing protein [Virgibacillus soli]MDY0409894.1 DUF2785 domain-containing protein [Virgibacillus soli]
MTNLKATLQSLNFHDHKQIQQLNLDVLIEDMLQNIGSTDPVLRDELIYTTFGNLIYHDFFTIEQRTYLLQKCVTDDYLFYRIGESKTDSVFTRSFSALVLALLLNHDREKLDLPIVQIKHAIACSINYLNEEQDTRGYVEEKGWAHSIAHGADYLAAAINHPVFDMENANNCLDTMMACLFKDGQYKDEEDNRLLFAVDALISRNLKEQLMIDWIMSMVEKIHDMLDSQPAQTTTYHQRLNVTAFLKSLYFRLSYHGDTYTAATNLIHEKYSF